MVVLAVVFMVLAVVLVVAWPRLVPKNDKESDQKITSDYLAFDYELSDYENIYPLGNGFLKVSKDSLLYLNYKGQSIYDENLEMESPRCVTAGSYALIVDMAGSSYLVCNTETLVHRGQVTNTIDYGSINEQGYACLIYDKPGTMGRAKFFSPEGKTLFEWESEKSGFIVSAAIAPHAARIDVSVYNTDKASPYSLLRAFGKDGSGLSMVQLDVDDLLPLVLYDEDGNPALCGEKLLYFPLEDKKFLAFSEILTSASSPPGILVAGRVQENDGPALHLIANKRFTPKSLPLKEEVKGLSVYGKTALIRFENSLAYVDLEEMKEVSLISTGSRVIRAAFNSDGSRANVVTSDGIRIYNLGG